MEKKLRRKACGWNLLNRNDTLSYFFPDELLNLLWGSGWGRIYFWHQEEWKYHKTTYAPQISIIIFCFRYHITSSLSFRYHHKHPSAYSFNWRANAKWSLLLLLPCFIGQGGSSRLNLERKKRVWFCLQQTEHRRKEVQGSVRLVCWGGLILLSGCRCEGGKTHDRRQGCSGVCQLRNERRKTWVCFCVRNLETRKGEQE